MKPLTCAILISVLSLLGCTSHEVEVKAEAVEDAEKVPDDPYTFFVPHINRRFADGKIILARGELAFNERQEIWELYDPTEAEYYELDCQYNVPEKYKGKTFLEVRMVLQLTAEKLPFAADIPAELISIKIISLPDEKVKTPE